MRIVESAELVILIHRFNNLIRDKDEVTRLTTISLKVGEFLFAKDNEFRGWRVPFRQGWRVPRMTSSFSPRMTSSEDDEFLFAKDDEFRG